MSKVIKVVKPVVNRISAVPGKNYTISKLPVSNPFPSLENPISFKPVLFLMNKFAGSKDSIAMQNPKFKKCW